MENNQTYILTMKRPHGLMPGDRLIIHGVTDVTDGNGSWIIVSVTDTTVTLRPKMGFIEYLKSLFMKLIKK